MNQFKETHKNFDHLMSTQHTTADLKDEIENMQEQKEQLIKRLERLKKRVESVNNSKDMLEMSRTYRIEMEREEKIKQQKSELKSELSECDQKIERLEKIVKEQKASQFDINAENIIKKMEEENAVNLLLVKDHYPKEIKSFKQKLQDCETINSKSNVSSEEVQDIKKKIEEINADTAKLITKRDSNRDLSDDKLIVFRQQALIASRKKDKHAETLNDLRSEYAALDKRLKEKFKNLEENGGTLKGEDFKKYVIKLRSKSNGYKSKRQEISELQKEYITIKRTEEIIKKQYDLVKDDLTAEEKSGIENKLTTTNLKDKTEELVSKKELKQKIAKKKSELAPFVKELKVIRDSIDEISGEYETRKSKYDKINAGFESNRSTLEHDVRTLADEYRISEARYHYLNTQKMMALVFQKRAQDEIKLYTKHGSDNKSFRDQLKKAIDDQELLSSKLKDKKKSTVDVHVDGKKQMKLFKDLLRQMELKRKLNRVIPF
jgi:intraflagellar transport protein 81